MMIALLKGSRSYGEEDVNIHSGSTPDSVTGVTRCIIHTFYTTADVEGLSRNNTL